MTLSFFP